MWDAETENPKAHITVSLRGNAEQWYRDTDDWTLANRPLYSVRHQAQEITTEYSVIGEGVVSETGDLLYLGDYEERSTRADGQQIRLVIPDRARPSEDPGRILNTIADAAEELDVACVTDTVTLVAAPTRDVEWDPIGVGGDSGVWIRDYYPLDVDVSVGGCAWIHEYLHTRQGFRDRLTPGMQWLSEAVVSYYAALLPFRIGLVSYDEFLSYVEPVETSGVPLTETHSHDENPDYIEGRQTIAALDCEIRKRTNHSYSFEDVFFWLNISDTRQITYSWFVSLLNETVDGSSYDEWAERYIRSPAVPSIPDSRTYFE